MSQPALQDIIHSNHYNQLLTDEILIKKGFEKTQQGKLTDSN